MKERLFRFKKFSVCHSLSAMKVGVDGVLIGAWGQSGESGGDEEILDIGTGCGIIALMAAQRNPRANITAVEIDGPSASEAEENFKKSPWGSRIMLIKGDVAEMAAEEKWHGKFDYIISNPPFFAAGLSSPITPREMARHEGVLSPDSVLSIASRLLKEGGKVSLIAPADAEKRLKVSAEYNGLNIRNICRVSDNPMKSPKRIMITAWRPPKGECRQNIELSILHIKNNAGGFSEEYISLTKDFYLNF